MSAGSLPSLSSTDPLHPLQGAEAAGSQRSAAGLQGSDDARYQQNQSDRACAIYWRLYWAWIEAPEAARERHHERLTEHIKVCGCRMGMGGRQDETENQK